MEKGRESDEIGGIEFERERIVKDFCENSLLALRLPHWFWLCPEGNFSEFLFYSFFFV